MERCSMSEKIKQKYVRHGPWDNEPDRKKFTDKETGYCCVISRASISGSLCGYVGIPESHPLYGRDYMRGPLSNINVHGGLTFSDHIRDDIAPLRWWFGFDCAHFEDISPGYDYTFLEPYAVYRTWGYVKRHVKILAEELKKNENEKN